ncbi:Transcription initiation factor TFIID subunit 5 [Lunasporangiospora selenospora]|uniref:Transcription initiation factor TFIID subunit 5 n=1 Tax=Lunasporangiospora selenospora TaxID=979761 RepID=A0A9P6FV40_9FUNG|nr:Transcription initiation factor TFIID subunit 5 [Lunasporangiospora selenospora]
MEPTDSSNTPGAGASAGQTSSTTSTSTSAQPNAVGATQPQAQAAQAQPATAATPAVPPPTVPPPQQEVDKIVLHYLNQKGYKQAELALKREANLMTLDELQSAAAQSGTIRENAEMSDPDAYDVAYSSLKRWVENSLDLYKPELMAILFPLFVHSYLNLVSRGLKDQAKKFMESYRSDHLEMHSPDIARFSTISDPQHVKENDLAQIYKTNKYHLRLSPVSFELLIAFLQDNKFILLLRIVNQHLEIQVGSANVPRTGEAEDVVGISGHGPNQLTAFNQQSVTLGQMPPDTGFREQVEQTMKEEEAIMNANGDVSMTGSLLEEYKKVKSEAGVDSPSRDDVPLPPFKGSDIQAEIEALRDVRKRVALGPSSLPSICSYTFHNAHDSINCVAVSEDATMMAAGFSESYVRLWSLKGEKLKGFRSNFNPAQIHDSSDLDRVREKNGTDSRKLIGHAGPVFGASFSPDNKYLITCSEDMTARLWSTNTLTNVVCYKGHNYPLWDVDFGPQGFYFATASHDRTARLWSCDHIYPLRIFAGHLSDVDGQQAVKFHPNSKYLVTGSSDKTARLWDIQRGTCVRVFTGHTGAVHAIAMSPDGRMMASAGEDRSIQLWDLGSGKRMKKMTGHQGVIYSLDFSKDGSLLVSGSADCTVRAWDVKKDTGADGSGRILQDGREGSGMNGPASAAVASPTVQQNTQAALEKLNKKALHAGGMPMESDDLLASFPTKRTPVYKVQFTKRNLCLAVGAFSPN